MNKQFFSTISKNLVRSVEWLGSHPLATGLFAILGLLGLVLSVYSGSQSSKQTSQITDSVRRVEQNVSAQCGVPPCWTVEELIDGRLLRATKDLITQKIPAAETKNRTGYYHKVEGCRVKIFYYKDVVTYYTVSVGNECPFSWSKLFNIDFQTPVDRRVVVRDILDRIYSGSEYDALYIAGGCISCGNAADPYVEFVKVGSHAEGRSYFFTTSFISQSDPSDYTPYRNFIAFLERDYPGRDLYPSSNFCHENVLDIVSESIMDVVVEQIGISDGGIRRTGFSQDACAD